MKTFIILANLLALPFAVKETQPTPTSIPRKIEVETYLEADVGWDSIIEYRKAKANQSVLPPDSGYRANIPIGQFFSTDASRSPLHLIYSESKGTPHVTLSGTCESVINDVGYTFTFEKDAELDTWNLNFTDRKPDGTEIKANYKIKISRKYYLLTVSMHKKED